MVDLRRSARVAAGKKDIPSTGEQEMAGPALKKAKRSVKSEVTKPPAGEDESPSGEGEELWKLSKDGHMGEKKKARRGSKTSQHADDSTKPPAGEDETGNDEELHNLPREQPVGAKKGRRGSKSSQQVSESTKPPAGEDETGNEELHNLPREQPAGAKKGRRGSKTSQQTSESTKPPAGEDETSSKDEELWKLKKGKENDDMANDSDATAQSTEIDIGGEIPDVTLQNQDGKDVSLREVAKDSRIIIIFAYPKASTPGCTRQACGFRDNYEELKEHAAVFGLSGDTVTAQKKFQDKQGLPFDLLSDPKRVLIGHLGAKKTAQSGTIRSHWVFFDGKLKYKRVKVSPEVSIQDGKKEVLELAAQL